MGEIKTRQENPGPGIEYSELHIPDEENLGTGSYRIVLEPNALAKRQPTVGLVINPPIFQMSVNVNPATKEIPVLLGKADDTPPISEKVFRLPENIELSDSYEFNALFANWEIAELLLNRVSLPLQTQPGTVVFWVDPAMNPGAFTDGVNYTWGVFTLKSEECTVLSEGRVLSAYMNRGTQREVMVFGEAVMADADAQHMIALTWDSDELNLYFDDEPLQKVKIANLGP